MALKNPARTLYPQWHKKYVSNNPELEKRIRNFQREEYQKNKKEKEILRKNRLIEYSYIDEKQYHFTWDDFQNYLTDKNFNIDECYIPNIIAREKREYEEMMKRKEEERIKREEEERRQIEYLRNYDDDDYLNYFYEGEAFIDYDSEENYNNTSDLDDNYSSDDNLY